MIQNKELQKQSLKILELINEAEKRYEEDEEFQSHFAKYICILCSGFMENAVELIYSDFIKRITTSEELILFIESNLQKILNPNSEKLKNIVETFNKSWKKDLNDFLQIDEKSAALNYIIKQRHKIAHGEDSLVTLGKIRDYHLKTVEIIEFLENQCNTI